MSKNPFPVRMCSGCMARKPKSELIRVVYSGDGKAIIDSSKKHNGRGVYICTDSPECIRKAEKRNWFSRGLKNTVDSVIYDELRNLCDRA